MYCTHGCAEQNADLFLLLLLQGDVISLQLPTFALSYRHAFSLAGITGTADLIFTCTISATVRRSSCQGLGSWCTGLKLGLTLVTMISYIR